MPLWRQTESRCMCDVSSGELTFVRCKSCTPRKPAELSSLRNRFEAPSQPPSQPSQRWQKHTRNTHPVVADTEGCGAINEKQSTFKLGPHLSVWLSGSRSRSHHQSPARLSLSGSLYETAIATRRSSSYSVAVQGRRRRVDVRFYAAVVR